MYLLCKTLFNLLSGHICVNVASTIKFYLSSSSSNICFYISNYQARTQILQIHTKEWIPKLSEPFLAELAEKCAGKFPFSCLLYPYVFCLDCDLNLHEYSVWVKISVANNIDGCQCTHLHYYQFNAVVHCIL